MTTHPHRFSMVEAISATRHARDVGKAIIVDEAGGYVLVLTRHDLRRAGRGGELSGEAGGFSTEAAP